MGCDIHATLEKKLSWGFKNSKGEEVTDWVSAGHPFESVITRDYSLFSCLADCGRNPAGTRPISKDRGLPPDVSDEFEAYAETWDDDGHSHGYATLTEIRAYQPRDNGFSGSHLESLERIFWALRRRMERIADELDGDGESVRIVFFFDN